VSHRLVRPLRLVVVAAVAAALVSAVTGPDGVSSAGAAPAPSVPPSGPPSVPADPQPTDPAGACAPGDGVVVTAEMIAEVAQGDGHAPATPAGGSIGAGGCDEHVEDPLGWPDSGIPAPPDLEPGDDDYTDPFERAGREWIGYQFLGEDGIGLPDYWEQKIAFTPSLAAAVAHWPVAGEGVGYVITSVGWGSETARETVEGTLPRGPECRWHGPVPAARMYGRVRAYQQQVRTSIYRYDHVPQPAGPRRFAGSDGGGGWFHYLCGTQTPSGIAAAPGGRLRAVEADYYLTPHWVYARNFSGQDLDTAAPFWRAARALVNAEVVTSPAQRGVTRLRTWMWAGARRYDIVLGGRRATVEPTGIVVTAPGVPLVAHDLRRGGCRDGGMPDPGTSDARTDCWFMFTKANSPDPNDFYTVGFALRWKVTVQGVGPAMTFWTTTVRQYRVGEVQVPIN
jgi:hypothetical protein